MSGDWKEISRHIIGILLGKENTQHLDSVGYTADKSCFANYKLVIIPSNFTDDDVYLTPQSLPSLPLPKWEGIPLVFGESKIEKFGDTVVLHADIVASSFFLISRYEEIVRKDERDIHGRFPGKSSLPFRGGFLERPIIDEYGKALRNLLRNNRLTISEPPAQFEKINLTHDADQLAHYRNLRGMAGAISRVFRNPSQAFIAIKSYFGGIKHDPWYTFSWLFAQADFLRKQLPNTAIKSIVFVKSGGGELNADKPLHDVSDNDFKKLFRLCAENEVRIGLHPSYQAGIEPNLIFHEKDILDKALHQLTTDSRNHFLCSREPQDMQALVDAGLSDDFTMAYADVAGFRIGTCKPTNWVNPNTLKISSLILHPLTVMDSTLSDKRYMNLTAEEAFLLTKKLIDSVKVNNGELTLLWHNTSVEKKSELYHRELYAKIIIYLKTICLK